MAVPGRNGFDMLRSNVTTADGQQQQKLRRLQSSFVDAAIITTYAGSGTTTGYNSGGYNTGTFSGDGGPATSAGLNTPFKVAVDISGNLFIADFLNHRIRMVTKNTGIITTIAGNGVSTGDSFGTFGGDGGPATSAGLNGPHEVAFDISGNVFIADSFNQLIRLVTKSTGIITTYAGGSGYAFIGDGGPATSAGLSYPFGVALDISGNVFIADGANHRIRVVTRSSGIITTFAGNGATSNMGISGTFSGDGGPATSAGLDGPWSVAFDTSGNMFIADRENSRIRLVTKSTGIITTYAGGGASPFSGDGSPATSVAIANPEGVAFDISGNVFITDGRRDRVLYVTKSTGIITLYAGTGVRRFSGDGAPATSAALWAPAGVAVDISGNVFIADAGNHRIRVVTRTAACSPGSYVSGSTCASCAAGTSNAGVTALGSAACLYCPAGAYSSAGATACNACPAGSYGPLTGSSICTLCPANTYNATTGSTSVSACIACSGAYVSNPGSSTCYLIPPTPAPTVRTVSPSFRPTSVPLPLAVVRVTQTITGLDLATVASVPFQNRFFAIQSLISKLPISAFSDFAATAGRRRSLLQSSVSVAYTVSVANSNPATLSALLSAPIVTALVELQLKATYASIAVATPSFINQSPTSAPTPVGTTVPALVVLRATQSISG